MKRFIIILLSIFLLLQLQSCNVLKGWQSYSVQEPNGRSYLKDMKFKESFKSEMGDLIDENAIYYRYYENESIDFKLHSGIRFFKTGQYIGYGSRDELDYSIFTELKKGGIGYYNVKVKDSIIILEYPNHLFRRSGKRNLDKYKILSNGDLESITKSASDYGAVYKKIPLSEKNLIEVVPDW